MVGVAGVGSMVVELGCLTVLSKSEVSALCTLSEGSYLWTCWFGARFLSSIHPKREAVGDTFLLLWPGK